MNVNDYKYKIELHAHTNPGSGCSSVSPERMVAVHKKSGCDAVVITNHFEPLISTVPLLVSFMSMLTGTGGNCGSQSSTMVIQGMAMEEIRLKDFFRVVFKEFRIALICSVILAAVIFVRIIFMYQNVKIAAIVSITLIGTVILSKLLGCMLPMLAKKLHIDPAIMSAPLLSTLVDSCSTLLYFTIAMKILNVAV